MILEYLQPDPSALDAGFVMLRAATHVAMLGAAGLGLFGIGFGAMLAADDQARLRRWMLGLALAGIGLNLGVVPLRVLVLAARHRWQLVPRLPSRGGGSLARSIRIETALALLVAWAAAELVSVHPLDAGHRIPG